MSIIYFLVFFLFFLIRKTLICRCCLWHCHIFNGKFHIMLSCRTHRTSEWRQWKRERIANRIWVCTLIFVSIQWIINNNSNIKILLFYISFFLSIVSCLTWHGMNEVGDGNGRWSCIVVRETLKDTKLATARSVVRGSVTVNPAYESDRWTDQILAQSNWCFLTNLLRLRLWRHQNEIACPIPNAGF